MATVSEVEAALTWRNGHLITMRTLALEATTWVEQMAQAVDRLVEEEAHHKTTQVKINTRIRTSGKLLYHLSNQETLILLSRLMMWSSEVILAKALINSTHITSPR